MVAAVANHRQVFASALAASFVDSAHQAPRRSPAEQCQNQLNTWYHKRITPYKLYLLLLAATGLMQPQLAQVTQPFGCWKIPCAFR